MPAIVLPGPAGCRQFAPGDVLPPLRDPAAAPHVGRRDENDRARNEQLLGHVGMRLGIEPALGQRAVAGGVDELLELRVRHLVTVDPEAVDAHDMGEALLRLMALRAHL